MLKMPSGSSSGSVVSPRPRAGGRYNNNRVTCTGLSAYSQSQWGKLTYPGGPKLWRRLVMAFSIMALFGAVFLVLGAVFLESARKINEESGISLPVVWCIIGIVCGSLMIACSLVLGKKMISSKWRKNEQPNYNRANANSSLNNSDSYRETFVPSSRSRSDTNPSSVADLDLPPPYELNVMNIPQPALPPAAVFIISGGDVNLAVPAVIQNSNSEPPKYTGLVDPPTYSESDPCKPPKYEETYFQTPADIHDGSLDRAVQDQSLDMLANHSAQTRVGGASTCQSQDVSTNQNISNGGDIGSRLHLTNHSVDNIEMGGATRSQSNHELTNHNLPQNNVVAVLPAAPESQSNITEDSSSEPEVHLFEGNSPVHPQC